MAPVGAGLEGIRGTGRTGELVEKERGRERVKERGREGMRGKWDSWHTLIGGGGELRGLPVQAAGFGTRERGRKGGRARFFCGGVRPADGLLQTIEQGQMQLQRCSHTEASAALVL